MKKTISLTIGILLACVPLFGQGLHLSSYSINGNNEHTLFAGDTVLLSFTIDNQDAFAHQNCEVTISSFNPNIEFLDSLESFDYIGAGNQYHFNNSFQFVVSPATRNQQVIYFTIVMKSEQGQYSDLITCSVISFNLKAVSYTIADHNNHNNLINASENDSIIFSIKNMDYLQIRNIDLVLRTNCPEINVLHGSLHKDSIISQEEFIFPTLIQSSSNFEDGTTFDAFIDILIDNQLQSTLIVSILGTNNTITFEEGNDYSMLTNPLNFPSWQTDSSTAFSGFHSLKSGTISHYDSTAVQYEFTTLQDGDISFAYKISTESSYDWLYFFLDGQQISRWSGLHDWDICQHTLPAGNHTALWIYIKDKSVNNNSDCVWIDDIRIPDNRLAQATFALPTDSIERTLDRTEHNTEDVSISLSNTSDYHILFENSIVSEDDNQIGWVTVSPSNGSVNGHQQRDISLHFTAEEILPGDYHARLEVRIDQLDTIISIPLILHVQSLDGIEEHENAIAMSIYPNPTNGRFTISSETEEIQTVSIYDLSGKMVLREHPFNSHSSIDLSDKPIGMYILKIETEKGISTQKIILQ